MPNWNLGIDPVTELGWPALTYGSGHLTPISYNGVKFPNGVRIETYPLWMALLDELVPLIPGGLVSGTCWGFTEKPLFHGSGLALDLNAAHNPRVSRSGQMNRGEYGLPMNTDEIVRKYGCRWGGKYRDDLSNRNRGPDQMHIEMHLYLSEVTPWISNLNLGGGMSQYGPASWDKEDWNEFHRQMGYEVQAEQGDGNTRFPKTGTIEHKLDALTNMVSALATTVKAEFANDDSEQE